MFHRIDVACRMSRPNALGDSLDDGNVENPWFPSRKLVIASQSLTILHTVRYSLPGVLKPSAALLLLSAASLKPTLVEPSPKKHRNKGVPKLGVNKSGSSNPVLFPVTSRFRCRFVLHFCCSPAHVARVLQVSRQAEAMANRVPAWLHV